jgi:alpha-galactosidase
MCHADPGQMASLLVRTEDSVNQLISRVSDHRQSGRAFPAGTRLDVSQGDDSLTFVLTNTTDKPIVVRDIVLADIPHGLPADAPFYGEGFSMFGGTVGTLGKPIDIDPLTDHGHYKLPQPAGFRTVYNCLRVSPANGPATLIGFASCRRFHGRFNVNDERLQIVLNGEGVELGAGESWTLEELFIAHDTDADELMTRFAARIEANHPRLKWPTLPTGWCSWYCYWADVTAEKIRANLAAFREHLPGIRYIQIDDGYQPQMGDWLEPTDKFKEGVEQVVREIRDAGFEPAIWVAPFIASSESKLFKDHPDWFVKDEQGNPLPSSKVTFGGWRQGPWYMLDGTHPEAQAYLEHVFRTMRGWGCTYFKLDATMWGALPAGVRHDRSATSVEAYRRGMDAVRRGAGPDAFILGCNQAYWPSLGTIHGSRTSYDINRDFKTFARVARQNLMRNWMNDRLWWNDPDCLLIPDLDVPAEQSKRVSADEFSFHAAATYASGGMLLSGDAVVNYTPAQWDLLKRAAARPPIAARFQSDALEVGFVDEPTRRVLILLNWTDEPVNRRVELGGIGRLTDYWNDAALGAFDGTAEIVLPPRAGRVIVVEREPAQPGADRSPREIDVLRRFPPGLIDSITGGGRPDAAGMVGFNKTQWYEAGMQRGAMWTLIAAVLRNDEAGVDDAWRAIDATFARQLEDGGFLSVQTPDARHAPDRMSRVTTAFFWLQEFSHAMLVLQQSDLASKYADRIEALKPKIRRAYAFVLADLDQIIAVHRKATNRLFIAAKAFGLGGVLLDDPTLSDAARRIVREALAQQDAAGFFPENGGLDTGYNAVAILFAHTLAIYLNAPELDAAIDRAMAWQLERIDNRTGIVDVSQNTRTGRGQETYMGKVKTLNYAEIAMAIGFHSARRSQPDLIPLAEKVYEQRNAPK